MTDSLLPTATDRVAADALRAALACDDGAALDPARWSELARAGWLELLVDTDLSVPQAIPGFLPLLEVLGHQVVPGPVALSIGLAAPLLAASGSAAPRAALGDGRIFTAATEVSAVEAPPGEIVATPADGRFLLTGRCDLVPWLRDADEVLVRAARPDGAPVLACVRLASAGTDTVHAHSIDPTTSTGSLILSGAAAVPLTVTDAELDLARACYSLVLDAQAIGSAAELVRRTVAYVTDRRQFGQAIGSFQAVKHRIAEMVRVTEVARSMAWLASTRFAASPTAPPWEDVDASRVCAGDAARRAAAEAIQCFGGMGFTWEQGLHQHYRRTLLAGSLHGNVEAAARRLVRHGVAQAASAR
ncbi:acyl-CoA dehydrogenase family protein [Pseudofrankia inefficax]|uniref:Acyl-CoA dehydrogenase domain-containing protein n=1 Tax=Pseudofrankia inefficax (strain DSM 45817 / CECT 9037 / DDB 130130 / EuI1c) TaxID=298654 RepID=E3J935_PSEI1|nr:acyl-CoA dehydrogenase family protein [Pseudofrankia inefficax]ADP80914.1 acyl-CoA dehydrogenase domain-containing protein [Pseudofrankia inefficax]